MTMRSFFITQLSCMRFVLRNPLALILWLLIFAILWAPLIVFAVSYEFFINPIVEILISASISLLLVPMVKRFSVEYYFKKLGIDIKKATALPIKSYLTLLHSNLFIRAAHLKGFSVFFRPHQLLNIPISIKEGLVNSEEILNRTTSLVNNLSEAEKKSWNDFFQKAAILNLCVVALFFGIMFFDVSWLILSFILAGSYIMALYALYSVLFYASVLKIPLSKAPETLQKLVNNMKYH